MRLAIGVDPDTTSTALAVVDVDTPQVLAVYLMKQRSKKGREATLEMLKLAHDMHLSRNEKLPGGEQHVTSIVHETVAIAVEGQELYMPRGGRGGTKNPRSILWLAPISGVWMALLKFAYPEAQLYFPAPAEWKGQVPKQVHHMRIGKALGWAMAKSGGQKTGYGYPENVKIPLGDKINKSDWKHAMDAVGLALWAGEQARKAGK